MVHISAIGADTESLAEYARAKAAGEAAVTQGFPGAVILRPSVVFGQDDGFFNRFAAMARLIPLVLPLVGAGTQFQPVWVEDVAEAAVRGCEGKAAAGIYELGGPTVMTLREAVALMLRITRRKRLVVDTPFFFARIQAWFLQMLPNPLLTVDQVKLLDRDNVVAEGARTLADLGIEPAAPEGLVESYLYAYRPQGQYTQLTENGNET